VIVVPGAAAIVGVGTFLVLMVVGAPTRRPDGTSGPVRGVEWVGVVMCACVASIAAGACASYFGLVGARAIPTDCRYVLKVCGAPPDLSGGDTPPQSDPASRVKPGGAPARRVRTREASSHDRAAVTGGGLTRPTTVRRAHDALRMRSNKVNGPGLHPGRSKPADAFQARRGRYPA